MKAHQVGTLLLATFLLAPALRAEDPKLPPWHVKAGVTCHDCHQKEKPDKAAVPDDGCMVCHGDYPAMAAYTKNLPVNPHALPKKAGHPGPFQCTECHHQHKAAVVKCLECHPDFKLKPK